MSNNIEKIIEEKTKAIHQYIYDDEQLKDALSMDEKLTLFSGLIMAGLTEEGEKALGAAVPANGNHGMHDGIILASCVIYYLQEHGCTEDFIDMVAGQVFPVFTKPALWKPDKGSSALRDIFYQVKDGIIPCLGTRGPVDYTGTMLEALFEWGGVEGDPANDIVLTPGPVRELMVKLARTDMDSYVWDRTMGTGGLLMSAMDGMMQDAADKIRDQDVLKAKIKHIRQRQLFGVESLPGIYTLAALNVILAGGSLSHMVFGNSHKEGWDRFPATVLLLNPPYSAAGKGMVFVEEAICRMGAGYACVLIQENAGSGRGGDYTRQILQDSTLLASIHMPVKLFGGKANVQAAIYLFQAGRPHRPDDMVKFIDFSNDGYIRKGFKKCSSDVNLKDEDNAAGRYAEVADIILGRKPKTQYYTKGNGLYIEDTISLEGNDWTFMQHKPACRIPPREVFERTVRDYWGWRVSRIIKGGARNGR